MVPIGKLGFMKGRIINTNQVFVSLGGGWFVKTCSAEAQEICTRRILECNGMLEKLEKEKKLFEGWTALSSNQIFASGESKEIIEPYDDKVEASWRVRHAEKVGNVYITIKIITIFSLSFTLIFLSCILFLFIVFRSKSTERNLQKSEKNLKIVEIKRDQRKNSGDILIFLKCRYVYKNRSS